MPCPDVRCQCQFRPDHFLAGANQPTMGVCVCGHPSFLHTEAPERKRPRAPTEHPKPFTRHVIDCTNLTSDSGACRRENLVDIDETITDAMNIVRENIRLEGSTAGATRVSPLGYSRLARGGKTAFLMLLFDALKAEGFAPILVSFNGSFVKPDYNESQLESLVRLISLQMLDMSLAESIKFSFDQNALMEHISNTSEPVVLLIDELNIVSENRQLNALASQFLKDEFLDKRNRYLAFTTHLPIEVDTCQSSLTSHFVPPSARIFISPHQPLSTNLRMLQCMSTACSAVTPLEVTLYGGIPSLIYFVKSAGPEAVQTRFDHRRIAIGYEEEPMLLSHFIQEVLDGHPNHEDVRRFDMFSSAPQQTRVWWPICYISCILSRFNAINALPFKDVIGRDLTVHASRVEAGIDWELIVQAAIMLRCVDAKVNGSRGPFGVLEEETRPDVLTNVLVGECTTLEQSRMAIAQYMQPLLRPTVVIMTTSYAKFPDFDGFVCYKNSEAIVTIWGYQVKLGRAYPKRTVPRWMKGGWLIRGNAQACSNRKLAGWDYCSQENVIALLGYSLAPLCPNEWPSFPVDSSDQFD